MSQPLSDLDLDHMTEACEMSQSVAFFFRTLSKSKQTIWERSPSWQMISPPEKNDIKDIWNKVIRCEKYFFQTFSGKYLTD